METCVEADMNAPHFVTHVKSKSHSQVTVYHTTKQGEVGNHLPELWHRLPAKAAVRLKSPLYWPPAKPSPPTHTHP
eukprot:4090393-Amphidinium_carterae.1